MRYSNIDGGALSILHGFKKVHHYHFTRQLRISTYHKPLVSIFKKGVATLSQSLSESSSEYTSTESEQYTNLTQSPS